MTLITKVSTGAGSSAGATRLDRKDDDPEDGLVAGSTGAGDLAFSPGVAARSTPHEC